MLEEKVRKMEKEIKNLIIIGAGPAGCTAAIYAARARTNPLVITGSMPGGLLTLSPGVENFPGFDKGINGIELMNKMRTQAERFGALFVEDEVTDVDLLRTPFKVQTQDNVYYAKSIIIATGASPKRLYLTNEDKFIGKGISTCATCDAYFYKGKEVIIIGGGDSAVEEAIFLTRFANKVYIVHRRDELKASKINQERAKDEPKIKFIYNHIIEEYLGNSKITGAILKNTLTGKTSQMHIDGIFLAIGHTPNTLFLEDQIELDKERHIVLKYGTQQTSVQGVFSAGDVHDSKYRQAITASGAGCKAAMEAEKYLNSIK